CSDCASPEFYSRSQHDALPIFPMVSGGRGASAALASRLRRRRDDRRRPRSSAPLSNLIQRAAGIVFAFGFDATPSGLHTPAPVRKDMASVEIKTKKEIELLRQASQMAAETLLLVGEMLRPGITT